jgi:hypothetical protein
MRGGTNDVVKHRFYHGFDWDGLLDGKMAAPYKPKVPENMEKLGRRDNGKDTAKASSWNPEL